MINRNNYEIWFLDFAEGQLSQDEISVLYDFLDHNPGLKSEFEEFEEIKLEEEVFKFNNKEKLKQEVSIEKIDGLSDFEVLTIKKIEGDISEKEERELKSMLLFSSEYQREFEIFDKTKLNPSESFTYKNKESLKRKSRAVIPLWAKYVSSLAAMILLILFVNKVIRNNNSNKSDTTIVQNVEPINNNKNNSVETTINPNQTREFKQPIINREPLIHNRINATNAESIVIHENQNKTLDNRANNQVSTPERSISRNTFELADNNLKKAIQPIQVKRQMDIGSPKIEELMVSSSFDQELANQDNRTINTTDALTPKELAIKTFKRKLDIDDKDYNRINPVAALSAALDKTNIAQVKYAENETSETKVFAVNIGSFSFSRSWNSN